MEINEAIEQIDTAISKVIVQLEHKDRVATFKLLAVELNKLAAAHEAVNELADRPEDTVIH